MLLARQSLHLDSFGYRRALLPNDHFLQHILHPVVCGGPDPDFRDDRRPSATFLHPDQCEVPQFAAAVRRSPKVHGKYTGSAGVEEVNE